MWFIGVEVEQETRAPPPKKNPGSAPVTSSRKVSKYVEKMQKLRSKLWGKDGKCHICIYT